MERVFELLINSIFIVVMFHLFAESFLDKKGWNKALILPNLAVIVVQVIVVLYVPFSYMIVYILTLSVLVVTMYDGALTRGVMTVFAYLAILIIVDLSILLMLGIVVAINIVRYKNKPYQYYQAFFVVPLLSLYVVYNFWDNYLLVVSIIIINILMLKIYSLVQNQSNITMKNRLYLQQLALKKEYYQQIDMLVEASRKTNHDIKYHLVTIRECLIKQNPDEAKKYVDNLIEGNDKKLLANTNNITIDGIINSKSQIIVDNNIQFDANISIPVVLPFQNTDISILFGNMLENAIEATLKVEEKFIKLNIKFEDNILIVSCINSYNGEVLRRSGTFRTTKEDKNNHGFGTKSIVEVCEKYNGQANFEYSDNQFVVKAILMEQLM
ncbi:MAG: hypothetical protein ATN35_03675 [Epulopiscium sp. Nele67-Bin004]|nr:MAG: hypothetical protein ATN35_03675 [Epulopiscium sp. Nele67-Bin004]